MYIYKRYNYIKKNTQISIKAFYFKSLVSYITSIFSQCSNGSNHQINLGYCTLSLITSLKNANTYRPSSNCSRKEILIKKKNKSAKNVTPCLTVNEAQTNTHSHKKWYKKQTHKISSPVCPLFSPRNWSIFISRIKRL